MSTKESPLVLQAPISLGADPELFVVDKKGDVIGSEKIIPESGLKNLSGKIIRDGVQVEFNPAPYTCRQSLAHALKDCFQVLDEAKSKIPGAKVSFDVNVKVTKKEMKSLSPKSQELGCAPSFNIHDSGATVGVADASAFLSRSAGGHVHIGTGANARLKELFAAPEKVVALLDIIVGNTCVLIDRDSGNKIRRQTYGRAGEYRLPPHGLEYRTLSNFWLRSYPLMSFVTGLTRQAISIAYSSGLESHQGKHHDYMSEILNAVDIEDVVTAINNNDKKLALENFNKIAPILEKMNMAGGAIHRDNIAIFRHFITRSARQWFPGDPVKHWLTGNKGYGFGWESYIGKGGVVDKHMQKTQKLKDSLSIITRRRAARRSKTA